MEIRCAEARRRYRIVHGLKVQAERENRCITSQELTAALGDTCGAAAQFRDQGPRRRAIREPRSVRAAR